MPSGGNGLGGLYRQQMAGDIIAVVGDRLWSNAEWQNKSEGFTVLDAKEWQTHPPVEALMSVAVCRYRSGRRPNWQEVLPFYGRKPPIHQG